MVTDCAGLGFWDLGDVERVFIRNTFVILTIAIPAAAVVASYRCCSSRRRLMRPVHSTLGLTDTVDINTKPFAFSLRLSVTNTFFYAASSIVAFAVGYLAFVLVEFLVN
ncbi:MAG TPA: hypothetical protein VGN86_16545 [Pyrinomonadaceae bacterium]|nr:hypothetical protein [Pyrinomonadaceae bacterium]